MRIKQRWCAATGAVLAAAGSIAATPVTGPAAGARISGITLTAGEHTDVVIDIVRHGQRMPPYNELVTPSPDHPGPPLSDLGHQQADDVAHQLYDKLGDHVAGIFSGQAIRDVDTAAPFAALEHMSDDVRILPGLNEIDSGIYADAPLTAPGGFLYEVTPLLWSLLGLVLVSIPGSGEDFNGVIFNDRFTGAVDAMYNAAMANPVESDTGDITAVGFNNEADIAAWVAMNVKNPDVSLLLPLTLQTIFGGDDGSPLLPNTGIVELKGNPDDGWTLVSWNGQAVPQDPGLLTQLLVDLRDLITTPQTAAWHIYEAALAGDQAAFETALETGLHNIGTAIIDFPGNVFNDIVDAFQG